MLIGLFAEWGYAGVNSADGSDITLPLSVSNLGYIISMTGTGSGQFTWSFLPASLSFFKAYSNATGVGFNYCVKAN